jgi:hypothetical protein
MALDIEFKEADGVSATSGKVFVTLYTTSDGDPDTPFISPDCITTSEVEAFLQQIEKDIAEIRRKAAKKLIVTK